MPDPYSHTFTSPADPETVARALANVVYDHPARPPYPFQKEGGGWDLGGNDVWLRIDAPGIYRVHQRYNVPERMERLREVALALSTPTPPAAPGEE